MKLYRVIWTYYGTNGAEQGCNYIHAESHEAAEGQFYEYNRPFWKDEWRLGYCVEGVEEVEE